MKDSSTTYASRKFLDEHDQTDVNFISTSIYHQKSYSSVDITLYDCSFGWVIKNKEDVSKVLRSLSVLEQEINRLRKEVSCMKPEEDDLSSKE